MKAINESISVEARRGVPCRLQWGHRTYRTRRLLDYWVLQSRWWGCEERRVYFRIETDGGVMEVYRATSTQEQIAPGEPRTDRAARPPSPQRSARTGQAERTEHIEQAARTRQAERTERSMRPPLPMEGDTHTRERRRTDAVYRPDVRMADARRRASDSAVRRPAHDTPSDPAHDTPSDPASGHEADGFRWVLSKIVD